MSQVLNAMRVALPRFMGASASKKQKQNSDSQVTLSSHNWGNYSASQSNSQQQEDPLDFDLLAQYLLDDGTANGGPDFGIDIPFFATATNNHRVNPHDGSFSDPLSSVPVQQPMNAAPTSSPYEISSQSQAHRITTTNAPLTQQRVAPPTLLVSNVFSAPVTSPHSIPLNSAPQSIAPAGPVPSPVPPVLTHQHKRPRLQTTPSINNSSAPPVGMLLASKGTNFSPSFPQKGGRPKSQAQIDRRRERNRILARRTRLRKKFFFESLQKDVMDLQQENMILKEIVRSRINPNDSKAIIDSCKANEQLPSCVLEQCGDMSNLDRQDFNLMQSIQKSQQCFVITDPSLQDNPIVYASQDFLSLTGYSRDEVLGRNCRFLQGPETSQTKVKQIRQAVTTGADVTVTFVNYTADGTPFWNKLFIAALRDAQNNIVNFIGVSVKVAGPEAGDPEEEKTLPIESTSEEGFAYTENGNTISNSQTDQSDAMELPAISEAHQ
eukprot:CAMPEP_0197826606 /NCGR_PEP_ID=MMETSP1437-20131217/3546_1 /TAXON_ID=49252 ORGANISM="Eucampia antarctica, Strain CCMP1452" /NCGR_SAMPLE_ID=MMETSP1437 /ASSEMBLY_ACC=CAM_ASM_001096 /LENGTH=492 /DNA_ID=CAMNT_0043427115 /DNA_START=77 /DNA_END=1555 /DNA_ORIENTATION=-